jgi:hypothetical protein
MSKGKGKGDRIGVSDKRSGFAIIDNTLIDSYGPIIGAYGIAAYCILVRFARPDGTDSYPSYQTIANLMNTSRSTAKRAISKLVGLGLVEKEDRKIKGEPVSNMYTLLDIKKLETEQEVGRVPQTLPRVPQTPGRVPQTPDQDTYNKTPITRHLDQEPYLELNLCSDDDDAFALSVSEDRRGDRFGRADQATPAETETTPLLVLRSEAERQLDVYTGQMWDDREGWLNQRSFEELFATLLWCEVVGDRMDQDPDAIHDPVGFIRAGVEERKAPGLRPAQIERIEGRVALLLELAEKGLYTP